MSHSIDPLRRLAGTIVITVGVLWMLLCGACSAFFLYTMLLEGGLKSPPGQIAGALAIIFIPGAIGVGLGWGIYALGRLLAGRRKA